MLKFSLILFFFLNYDYSLQDYNPTSPSYQNNVWNPEYSNHITMHYDTFGQLSNFQDELKNDDGYENIVIIAVGQTNISDLIVIFVLILIYLLLWIHTYQLDNNLHHLNIII